MLEGKVPEGGSNDLDVDSDGRHDKWRYTGLCVLINEFLMFLILVILSVLFNQVKMAVQYMRRVIEKKAKFDIMDLNCLQVSPKTFIPALFGHAKDDKFIQPHHSDLIYKSYSGDKNIIYFDGDHNSSRPQFYYDSVSIFFYNVLHPPQISSVNKSKLEKYYDLGDLKVGAGMDECLLYEIITGVRSAGTDTASSSSAPPTVSTTKSVDELLSEIAPVTILADTLLGEDNPLSNHDSSDIQVIFFSTTITILEIQKIRQIARMKNVAHIPAQIERVGEDARLWEAVMKSLRQIAERLTTETIEVPATPLRKMQGKPADSKKEEKKKKASAAPKKPKSEKFEKLEALSRRLRHCILKRVNHRRRSSS
ncbi:hypothetical protein FEM48_Zijuj01G0257500 [Ziziphus jujuba var. spinosa]|uniref:Uncharacterized protein n=1 Tax=Ziziphus jujuba var. spinosa TaxID=714518 RepID=A0A978W4T6_ZIZJJ|nr:hypothetical protein FEM48_Zijuj01G0257500 [Ziziphus jujuba var. spinosa]